MKKRRDTLHELQLKSTFERIQLLNTHIFQRNSTISVSTQRIGKKWATKKKENGSGHPVDKHSLKDVEEGVEEDGTPDTGADKAGDSGSSSGDSADENGLVAECGIVRLRMW